MDAGWRPRHRDTLAVEEVEEDLLVYDPVKDQVHLLNVTASAIWELCDGTRTVSEIARELGERVVSGDHDIIKDVECTLGEFREKGLVE